MVKNAIFHAQRLASFKPKRRRSSAANSKTSSFNWPHSEPSPESLAGAGFYYNATEESLDNVTCFVCEKSLDGWEEGDDPVAEHLRHCPDCPWAITAAILATDDHSDLPDDPRGKRMRQARQQTFEAGVWPHETEGSLAAKNMAEAGWIFAPTADDNDLTRCPYCKVTVGGWESDDDPWEEHQRRAMDCVFFAFKKPTKARGKGSRASIQSNASRMSSSESVASSTGEEEEVPKPKKRGRKSSMTRKKAAPKKKTSRKNVESEREVSIESILDGEEPLVEAKKGRKRSSSIVPPGPVIIYDGGKDTSEEDNTERQLPPPKRRATRQSTAAQISLDNNEDSFSKNTVPAPIKMPKRSRLSNAAKRGSSTATRKVSRPIYPDDDDIDRALALDMERPLSDEEDFSKNKKPFIRKTKHQTRSRASLAVEQQLKEQPEGSLLLSRTSKAKTPVLESEGGTRSPVKTPFKNFFRKEDQDFSIPVTISKHLTEGGFTEHDDAGTVPTTLPQPKFFKEPSPKAEKAAVVENPAPKKGKGKKTKAAESETTNTEKPKLKRGKATKAVPASRAERSRSRSIDVPVPKATPPPATESEQEQEPELEPVQLVPEKPKRGRKPKAKVTAKIRGSTASVNVAPTEADAEPALTEAAERQDADVDNDTDVLPDTDAAQNEVSEMSVAPESDPVLHMAAVAIASKSAHKGKKVAQAKKKQPSRSFRSKPDLEKNTIDDGGRVAEDSTVHDVPQDGLSDDTDDTQPASDTTIEEKIGSEPPRLHLFDLKKGIVFASPELPKQEPHRGSSTEADSPAPAPSPSKQRLPLSPSRKQLTVRPASTPRNKPRGHGLVSSKPWTAADPDLVFSPHNGQDVDDLDDMELTEAEREMTVEDWVKWNARQGEEQLAGTAERMIAVFENEGERAIETIEGIEVV